MQLSEMQSLIADLANDANHDRYSLSQINTELDNWQDKCFAKAGVDSWAEMDTASIDKFIQFLKGKRT